MMNKVYPEYVSNQTLSHENLNDLFNYLDNENRQTRHYLIGTGILCGMHLEAKGANSFLTPGIAVSTEGYLLVLEKAFNFQFYRKFKDKGESYNPVNEPQIFEVLSEVPEDEKEEDLLKFHELKPQIQQGVVAVYLEDHLKDIESCEGESCDNKGKEHILSLKVLLIPENLAVKTFSLSKLKSDLTERHPLYNLGRLKLRRQKITPSVTSLDKLKKLFRNDIEKALEDLRDFMIKTEKAYPDETSQLDINLTDITEALKKIPSDYTGFQQPYDWFETLFRAVNEWISYVQANHFQCLDSERRFPRHVYAGSMKPLRFRPQFFRHYFEKAANDTLCLDHLEIQKLLAERVREIVHSVKVNNIKEVSVLPEKRSSGKLSDKAIPYFQNYDVLKHIWNPVSDLTERLDFDNFGVKPGRLGYSFEDKDFFRIEGHVGLSKKEALDQLNRLRENHNLEFDVRTVYVDKPDTLDHDDCCTYETIRLLYKTLRVGLQTTLLESFIDIFKLASYRDPQSYEQSPVMEVLERKGYESIDYRRFDFFEKKAAGTEAVLSKETLKHIAEFAKENEASFTVTEALKGTEEAIKENKTDTVSYKEDVAIVEDFALKNGLIEAEDTKKIRIIDSTSEDTMVKVMSLEGKKAEINLDLQKTADKNDYLERARELIENSDSKPSREIVEELQKGFREANKAERTKVASNLENFRYVQDGVHNLLVDDEKKQFLFVEAQPHLEKNHENIIEKGIPSLMVDLYAFQKMIPETVEDFSIDSLKAMAAGIGSKLSKIFSSIDEIHAGNKCHFSIKLVLFILGKIKYYSFITQLTDLSESYTAKQKKLEDRNILAQLVKNHPGLEHRAGVPIGGTFFLLFAPGTQSKRRTDSETEFIEFIKASLRFNENKRAKEVLNLIESDKDLSMEKLIAILEESGMADILGRYYLYDRRKREVSKEDFNFGDDKVIGDFCLRSTIDCCDLKYIVHTDLRLDSTKKIFCNDDKEINLDVHPRGGTIFGSGTSNSGHNYSFDPSHPDVEIGENILTYAIADQRVDLVIEVLEHPTAKIKVISKIIDDNEAVIRVTSTSKGADLFEWAYGETAFVEGEENHTFRIPVEGDSLDTVIRFRASNKACSTVVNELVRLTDVQLILDKAEFCSTDKVLTLKGKPEGGTFSGDSVKNGKFNPGTVKFDSGESVKSVEITYKLDGDFETKSVTVYQHPQASFEITGTKFNETSALIEIRNNTVPRKGITNIWDFNGRKEAINHATFEREVKLVDNKAVIELTAFHFNKRDCRDTDVKKIENIIEVDPSLEKAREPFEALRESNSKNLDLLKSFQEKLGSMEFNKDILTGAEIKIVRSLLLFVDGTDLEEIFKNADRIVKTDLKSIAEKLRLASAAKLNGPELTMYGFALVTALNIMSIAPARIAIGNESKSIAASFNKAKVNYPEIKYSIQELITPSLWLIPDNSSQAQKLWDAIQP